MSALSWIILVITAAIAGLLFGLAIGRTLGARAMRKRYVSMLNRSGSRFTAEDL
jgi:hypothetical protein